MDLDIENEIEIVKSINYLCRTNFHQIPDNELREIINNKIKYLIIGNVDIIYSYFVELVIDENILAKKIDFSFLNNFLKTKGFMLRDLAKDNRILPQIDKLNHEYSQFFLPIGSGVIEREEFLACKNLLD